MDTEAPSPGAHVLVIEDDPAILAILESQLRTIEQCSFEFVRSYNEAFKAIDAKPPGLILLAYGLGGSKEEDGFQQIRDRTPTDRLIVSYPVSIEHLLERTPGVQFIKKDENYIPTIITAVRKSVVQILLSSLARAVGLENDDELRDLNAAFSPGDTLLHYKILEPIAGGGMGEIYKAEDLSLGRYVAIKVLPVRYSKNENARKRLIREAQAASALNHPNIINIYSFEEYHGIRFIVMEYLEGQNLQSFLDGLLPDIKQWFDFAIQLTDALSAAHEAGLIHRDLKPQNIIVQENRRLKLLDFGIAKRIPLPVTRDDSVKQDTDLTGAGFPLGTVLYMSPEQTRGETLDLRSDIFSLGAVLYQAITGRLPFPGESILSIFHAISVSNVERPSLVRPGIPVELDSILLRCMEKKKEDRYQSAADLLSDLKALESGMVKPTILSPHPFRLTKERPSVIRRHWWIPTLILILVLGLFLTRDLLKPPPPPAIEEPAIAVLPFVNLSPDNYQEYFSDGLTEELINVLSKNPNLKVSSRTSAFSFKGTKTDIKSIAKKLNVTHVLEGSVRKSGNQLRITAQLIEASTDSHLWSGTFDRELENIFVVQEAIATSVAEALHVTLLAKQAESTHSPTPSAYNAYLQGRYFHDKRVKEDLVKAIDYYKEAIELDPAYARAWAGLAETHREQASSGLIPVKEGFQIARTEAERAIQLDPELAEAHAILGYIKRQYDWDWAGADEAYQRALKFGPGNASVLLAAAGLAGTLGRLDEAIALDQRAIQLDPLSIRAHYYYGFDNYRRGYYDKAEEAFKKVLELNPDYPAAHILLGRVYLAKSMPEQALSEMKAEKTGWRRYGCMSWLFCRRKQKGGRCCAARAD